MQNVPRFKLSSQLKCKPLFTPFDVIWFIENNPTDIAYTLLQPYDKPAAQVEIHLHKPFRTTHKYSQ